MDPLLVYLIKVNLAIVLFYGFYRLVFYNNTFLEMRRLLLVFLLAFAFLYPAVNINEWLLQKEEIQQVITPYIANYTAEEAVVTASSVITLRSVFYSLYLLGVILCTIKLLIEFYSILLLYKRGEKTTLLGRKVVQIEKEGISPFSFFKKIFLNQKLHSPNELEEILTHEEAHAREWHSLDLLFCEIATIVCWFNPFMWLYKRETRLNLECLADKNVIQSGYEASTYQYHLLRLTYKPLVSDLVNNFNVPQFKQRIKMMNLKKSTERSFFKISLIIPLVLFLLVCSNAEAIISLAQKELIKTENAEKAFTVSGIIQDNTGIPLQGTTVIVMNTNKGTISDKNGHYSLTASNKDKLHFSYIGYVSQVVPLLAYDKQLNVIMQPQIEEIDEVVVVGFGESKEIETPKTSSTTPETLNNNPESTVFTVVEKMPQFPGGQKAMFQFISQNIKYPVRSIEQKEEGRVFVSFVVSPSGKIGNAKVIRSVSPLIDKESLRIIESMPLWEPGKQRGRAVSVQYTIPITFSLSHPSDQIKLRKPVNAPQPLIIVDGEEQPIGFDIKSIDANTIESVNVLKDEKHTEAYKEKGKNGVIILTTKKNK